MRTEANTHLDKKTHDEATAELVLMNPSYVFQTIYGHEYRHRPEDCAECQKPKPAVKEER